MTSEWPRDLLYQSPRLIHPFLIDIVVAQRRYVFIFLVFLEDEDYNYGMHWAGETVPGLYEVLNLDRDNNYFRFKKSMINLETHRQLKEVDFMGYRAFVAEGFRPDYYLIYFRSFGLSNTFKMPPQPYLHHHSLQFVEQFFNLYIAEIPKNDELLKFPASRPFMG